MSTTYTLGFPRIGEKRELKFALEAYWRHETDFNTVKRIAKTLRHTHLNAQKEAGISLISVGDFSYYDTVLDTIALFNAYPTRFLDINDPTERYFTMARGDATHPAMAMTKWFNTNYHYIIPELNTTLDYSLNPSALETYYQEALELGITPMLSVLGPVSFLALSRYNTSETEDIFGRLLSLYCDLLQHFQARFGKVCFRFDEPALVCDATDTQLAFTKRAYETLGALIQDGNLYVATYFEASIEATKILVKTPITGVMLDWVEGSDNSQSLALLAKSEKYVGVGVVDGRNIWRNPLQKSAALLEAISHTLPKERIMVGSACSLLHVPYRTTHETHLPKAIYAQLAFAYEKLHEISYLSTRLHHGEAGLTPLHNALANATYEAQKLQENSDIFSCEAVQTRLKQLPKYPKRSMNYDERQKVQKERIALPKLPTTTIGSFPQTQEIRALRRDYKKGFITQEAYEAGIKEAIKTTILFQETCDIDVLVHGEFERNDMVEYFGEQLSGVAFTQNGWVQSYGARCVKPPMIYGDIIRKEAMSVSWTTYAQSLTKRPVKGMLTGPVTMLNWSFVRHDILWEEVLTQMALAIHDEIADLQTAGIQIIQVDEAAFKEGYPLKASKRHIYEDAAVKAFIRTCEVAKPETQIHTHMCYSDFNDILPAINAMDADVITIEAAKGGNRLLEAFKTHHYKRMIGPGIYDIHSPRVPSVLEMRSQIEALLEVFEPHQLWINPDCGLKTRGWEESKEALYRLQEATRYFR